MKDLIIKNSMGTRRQGSIFNVLNSFTFNMDNPELAMRNPPTIEISVIRSALIKSPSRQARRKMDPCHKKSTPAAIVIPIP